MNLHDNIFEKSYEIWNKKKRIINYMFINDDTNISAELHFFKVKWFNMYKNYRDEKKNEIKLISRGNIRKIEKKGRQISKFKYHFIL